MALRNTFTTTPYKISKKWRKCEKVKYIQHIFLERTNIGPEPYLKKNSESSDNILPCIHYHLIHCRAQLQLPFYRFKSLSDESDGYDEENVDTAEQLRSSHPEVFLRQAVLKICSNFSGEYPCRTAISIKLHAVLLKPHFGMSVLLSICCIFSEHLLLKTHLDGCVWQLFTVIL